MLRFLLLFLPLPAVAAEAAPPGVSAGTYMQAALALALIVSLLVGAAWLARKVSGGKGFGQGGMRVVGGVALGPRERIVLLEIGEEWLVVGIVPGQIRTLHRLPKGELPAAGLPGQPAFAQWLQNIKQRQTPA
ncbi:MAG: flagellar biosynthetic protein FliO [Azonexus sp.]|nr:flagellar biosynthetic protein FliO [Azonexus sp.]